MSAVFDLEALREQRAVERAAQRAPDPTIAACTLCDDDGYRNTLICDHIDHSATYAAGMAAVREALNQHGKDQP